MFATSVELSRITRSKSHACDDDASGIGGSVHARPSGVTCGEPFGEAESLAVGVVPGEVVGDADGDSAAAVGDTASGLSSGGTTTLVRCPSR